MNWTNKLEYLILESLGSLILCNIQAYWADRESFRVHVIIERYSKQSLGCK